MSLHRSFLSGRGTGRHCNVLSRVERMTRLQAEGRWDPKTGSVYGLPKVGNRKVGAK